jgi:hypothetical protein
MNKQELIDAVAPSNGESKANTGAAIVYIPAYLRRAGHRVTWKRGASDATTR